MVDAARNGKISCLQTNVNHEALQLVSILVEQQAATNYNFVFWSNPDKPIIPVLPRSPLIVASINPPAPATLTLLLLPFCDEWFVAKYRGCAQV